MQIVHSDSVFRVEPGMRPDYNSKNPLLSLMQVVERTHLAGERELYQMDSVQYLLSISSLELYGPAAPNHDVVDPRAQDFKTDFQKQNVRTFLAGNTNLTRGWVITDGFTTPFLRISYRGGPDTPLSRATRGQLGDKIRLWIKVGDVATGTPLVVPYNEASNRYEIELWSYVADDLRSELDEKGRHALERGELVQRGDLIRGRLSDFDREGKDEQFMFDVAPHNTMHPVLPLHVELAWSDLAGQVWDSQDGANYHYEFNMITRGWDAYLGVGQSPNPHGGVGFLEYRNLMSNYFRYADSRELARRLEPWNLDAHGSKRHRAEVERFFAVDYMDMHLLKADSGIGLHRHRDNQELFLMMRGQGFMVVGDWCKMPNRERCFEVRTLKQGHFAMLKGGNLHALMNPTDEPLHLFMCGGYD